MGIDGALRANQPVARGMVSASSRNQEAPLVKVIAMFNNKGGVSKTTTTFNLGWMLAARGHRVVMADADPQCNLTGMVLDLTEERFASAFSLGRARTGMLVALL